MKKTQILSGEELVAKGAAKLLVSLPELGLKDVAPNGSWLEQKQVQAALEARKHLVEVERIEKCGVLSHAEWNEELGLAEVTQQAGSYWHHMGHHLDKKLYLWPEEALFLMETSCLRLKYDETTVSLQQAYSLLLRGKITLLQYKVYASLSRLGYKILRHERVKRSKNIDQNKPEEKKGATDVSKELGKQGIEVTKSLEAEEEIVNSEVAESHTFMNTRNEKNPNEGVKITQAIIVEPLPSCSNERTAGPPSKRREESLSKVVISRKQHMLQQLMNRASYKKLEREELDRLFENVPEMCQKVSVTVSVPDEKHLPRNVFLNNTSYTLNLEKVRNRTTSVSPTHTRTYSASDEVNGASVRRIWGPSSSVLGPTPQNVWTSTNYPNMQNMQNGFNQQFWGFTQQRPRYNQFLFGYIYQRPLLPQMNFNVPRFFNGRFQRNQPFFGRPQPQQFRGFYNQHSGHPHNGLAGHSERLNRKRPRDGAGGTPNLYAIRTLAAKLKLLVSNNNSDQTENIQSLQRIINTYNRMYSTDIRLSANFEIVDAQENIVETITLEDDDEPKSKRANKESRSYEENFKRIKKLAQELRQLDKTGKGTSKHRRAFSNMLKSFNKTYDADVYVENYEIADRKLILLDSSDEDCIVEESPKLKRKVGRKLKNPFSVLNLALDQPGTSSQADTVTSKYQELSILFHDWLPKEDDFGTAEVLPQDRAFSYNADEEYLLDFITNYRNDCDNWNHIKMSFWESVEDSPTKEGRPETTVSHNSLVKLEDCKDMASVFQKLRIIQCCTEARSDTDLLIHFDVYSRDVANFRKSNRPTPHFRIVCVEETSPLPSGADVQAIHSRNDDAPLVFAVVSGASISYLQMRPAELPPCLPTENT